MVVAEPAGAAAAAAQLRILPGRLVVPVRLRRAGVVVERHFGLSDDVSLGMLPAEESGDAAEAVAAASPDCVVVLCKNLKIEPLRAGFEARLDRPVHDRVAVAVRGAVLATGRTPPALERYGGMFRINRT